MERPLFNRSLTKMLNLMMSQDRNWWSFLTISFTIFISLVSAAPQSSARRSGGINPEITFTIDGQPEITLPCDKLYTGSSILYVPVIYPISIRTAQVLSGPPDVGLLFVNTRKDGSNFASQAIYSPENKARYSGGTSALRGPFAAPNYIVLFRLPPTLDPNRLLAVLTNSEDEAGPSETDAGFHLYTLAFAGPSVTGLYAAQRFDEPLTLQQAALIHAPDPNARVEFYDEQTTTRIEITQQNELREPFDRAMFIVGGESPPPGPLVTKEDLEAL